MNLHNKKKTIILIFCYDKLYPLHRDKRNKCLYLLFVINKTFHSREKREKIEVTRRRKKCTVIFCLLWRERKFRPQPHGQPTPSKSLLGKMQQHHHQYRQFNPRNFLIKDVLFSLRLFRKKNEDYSLHIITVSETFPCKIK